MALIDAIALLQHLFLGKMTPPCLKAADADGSGSLEAVDAMGILGFLFLSGPPPAQPFPACGVETNPTALPCDRYAPCD